MPQPVPLAATLGVERPRVVVDDPRFLLVYVFVEGLPAEHHFVALEVERGVERDARAGLELGGGGSGDEGVGLAVEEAVFVEGTVERPGVEFGGGVGVGEGEGGEGDGRAGVNHFGGEWALVMR